MSENNSLQALAGIGKARAKKLESAGLSVKRLARSNPATVAKHAGVSETVAKQIIAVAQKHPVTSSSTKSSTKRATKKASDTKTLSPKKTAIAQKPKPVLKQKKTAPQADNKTSAVNKPANASQSSLEQRVQGLESVLANLTALCAKLDARIKQQQQDLHTTKHQLDYLSWDALPRVVHELAWYIKTHLDTWSEDKIVGWLKDHGHEERHIRQAISIARS